AASPPGPARPVPREELLPGGGLARVLSAETVAPPAPSGTTSGTGIRRPLAPDLPLLRVPGGETFARTLAGAGLAVESELTPDGSWLLRHGECDGRSGALTALRVDWR